jgi:uncharacterized protein
MTFNSTIIIVPGLTNSGEGHWQSIWERQFRFKRVNQVNWDTPSCVDWIEALDLFLKNYDVSETILVGHSLGCATIAFWAKAFNRKIKGALLVAPSDTEAASFPGGTTGFSPMPLHKLSFKSIVVASANDNFVTVDRAHHFATSWGSEVINIGNAGHINTASGHGKWDEGLEILKRLD